MQPILKGSVLDCLMWIIAHYFHLQKIIVKEVVFFTFMIPILLSEIFNQKFINFRFDHKFHNVSEYI